MISFIPKLCYYAFGLGFPLNLLYLVPFLVFFPFVKKLFKNKYFRILFFVLPSTIIFIKILRNDPFFLSDDFAHLKLVTYYSYFEILKMALSNPGIWVGHHIVSAFWLFKIIFDTFGTKVESYLFVNYILQVLNLIIFYNILEKIGKRTFISVFVTFLLGFNYLTWISNMHEILGGTFVLLAVYFWVKYLQQKSGLFLVVVYYLLALVSKEITFFLFPALILISIFYNFTVRKLEIKKYKSSIIILSSIFILYLLFFAWKFTDYSRLPVDEGYKIAFSIEVVMKNIVVYTSMLVPFLRNSYFLTWLFFVLFIGFDFWKRKPITTPFLVSYLLFLLPPSLFTNRISNYYTYIPSFFLFMGIAQVFWELARRKIFSNKFAVGVVILVITIYIFGVNKLLMDNCFLIQVPWQKPYTSAFYALRNNLNRLWISGELTIGKEIMIKEEEKSLDMQALYETGALQLFINDKEARNLSFIYNKDRGTLEVSQK